MNVQMSHKYNMYLSITCVRLLYRYLIMIFCPIASSLMLGIAIRYVQHYQAMLSFTDFNLKIKLKSVNDNVVAWDMGTGSLSFIIFEFIEQLMI